MNISTRLFELADICETDGHLSPDLQKELLAILLSLVAKTKTDTENLKQQQKAMDTTLDKIDKIDHHLEDIYAVNELVSAYLNEHGLLEDFYQWANDVITNDRPILAVSPGGKH